MKKLITMTIVAAMLLAMSACGGDNGAETTAAGTVAATEAGTSAATEETDKKPSKKPSGGSATVADETNASTEADETTAGEDEDIVIDYPRAPEDAEIGYSVEWLHYGVDPVTGEERAPEEKDSKLNPGSQRGVKFTVAENAWITILSIRTPSYGDDNTGNLLFDIYRWVEVERTADMDDKAYYKACYQATVGSGEKVESVLFENIADGQTCTIMYEDDLNMTIGNGTFLLVVSNPDEEDLSVGVYIDNFATDLPFHENNNTFISDIVHFTGEGIVKTRGLMAVNLDITYMEVEE